MEIAMPAFSFKMTPYWLCPGHSQSTMPALENNGSVSTHCIPTCRLRKCLMRCIRSSCHGANYMNYSCDLYSQTTFQSSCLCGKFNCLCSCQTRNVKWLKQDFIYVNRNIRLIHVVVNELWIVFKDFYGIFYQLLCAFAVGGIYSLVLGLLSSGVGLVYFTRECEMKNTKQYFGKLLHFIHFKIKAQFMKSFNQSD